MHASVENVVNTYLGAADAIAPGLVKGLYLTGSVALGDFRPHASDIDFIAVTATPLDAAAIAALRRAHQDLRRRCPQPFFDGRYVTWDDLARNPAEVGPGPYSEKGRFHARGIGECHPVSWHTLAQRSVACRGPKPAELRIWTNDAALRQWTLQNLDTYWQPLLRRARRVTDPWYFISFTSHGAAWMVLGVCRLHFTLATGRICSKEDAGEYGFSVFPGPRRRILKEALRIRRTAGKSSLYPSPFRRRSDVLSFVEMAIANAKDPS